MATINAESSGHTVPQEVLHMIFKAFLPGPRVFTIKVIGAYNPSNEVRSHLRKDITLQLPYFQPTITTTTDSGAIDVLLQVNQASRKIVLQHYQPAFAAQLAGKPIYFDFDIDTIFFQDWFAVDAMQGVQRDHSNSHHRNSRKPLFAPHDLKWQMQLKHVMASRALIENSIVWTHCRSFLKKMEALETFVVENTCVKLQSRIHLFLRREMKKGKRPSVPVISVSSIADMQLKAGI